MWILGLFLLALQKGTYAEDGVEKVACTRSGQIMNGSSGVITTPGYKESKLYPPRSVCTWKFELPPPAKYISLEFRAIDVEVSDGCKHDAVEVFSLNPPNLLKKYCGSEIPSRVILPSDKGILLRFRSDDLFQRKGAKIYYEIVERYPECAEGYMRCKNDKCVPADRKCNKIDECGDGTDEEGCAKLEFPKTCGRPKHFPIIGNGDRIIGGQEAVPHSWPWQISLQNGISHPSGHLCGGTLINNLWVLTAGHCLYRMKLDIFRIHLGMHSRFEKDDGEVIRYLNKTCIHPDFQRAILKDDIALIKLSAPVEYTDTIQPVCLPKITERLNEGKYCHVTGWGSTYGTGSYHVLKQTMVPIIDHDKCKKVVKALPLSPNTICSGFENVQYSPCFGDSGGPFVCDYNQAWHLSGVVSWGPMTCGTKEPSIYTKVADYMPWIERIIENDEKGVTNRCL